MHEPVNRISTGYSNVNTIQKRDSLASPNVNMDSSASPNSSTRKDSQANPNSKRNSIIKHNKTGSNMNDKLRLQRSITPESAIELSEERKKPRVRLTRSDFDQLESNQLSISTAMINQARNRAIKRASIIILSFLLCWAPYYTIQCIILYKSHARKSGNNTDNFNKLKEETTCDVSIHLIEWSFTFGMLNALVNPIVYGLFDFNTKFQWLRYFHLILWMKILLTLLYVRL